MGLSMPSRKQGPLDKELEALRPALADPDNPASHVLLRKALNGSRSFVAAKAAALIRDRLLGGFEDDLEATFERFTKDPVKKDPGCKAKLAALEALDYLESDDAAPFLAALRYVQLEPAWGKPIDTAGGVRARAALGLARVGHPDFMLLMADLLTDPEAPVREAAAHALAHHGEPAGAGLLTLKIHLGDPEPLVILACLIGLIALKPESGLARVTAHLHGEDEDLRELAALAMGESQREDALDLLLSALASEPLPRRRSALLRALGLHRRDRAVEALLQVVATAHGADAKLALQSLSARSLEPGLVKRVREAAERNTNVDLADEIRAAFA
jgi:hypothetical protein